MAGIVKVVAPPQKRYVGLNFAAVVKAHRILNPDHGPALQLGRQRIGKSSNARGVPVIDRGHYDYVSGQQFYALGFAQDADSAHGVVIIHRKAAAGWSGRRNLYRFRRGQRFRRRCERRGRGWRG